MVPYLEASRQAGGSHMYSTGGRRVPPTHHIQRYLFDDEPPVTEDGPNGPSVGPSGDCGAKGSNVLKRRLNSGWSLSTMLTNKSVSNSHANLEYANQLWQHSWVVKVERIVELL